MKRLKLGLVLLILAGIVPASAQTLAPLMPLRLSADLLRYRGSTDTTLLVEISYAMPRAGLTYEKSPEGWSGEAEMFLLVRRGDSLRYADKWSIPHHFEDSSALGIGLNLVGLTSLELVPGTYFISLMIRDKEDPDRKDSIAISAVVKRLPTDRFALSDLEFASNIRQTDQKGIFYKNTLEVVPNVGGVYGGDKVLWYYCEAYNLQASTRSTGYVLNARILDALGKTIITRTRNRKIVGESAVLVDRFPVNSLKSGTYSLVISADDSVDGPLASVGRKFFVYNPELGIDSTMLSPAGAGVLPEYAGMSEEELDREGAWVRYEATSSERDQLKQLQGTDSKKKFLSDFWRRRSPGLREVYLSRVKIANERYTSLLKEGWKTDQGRVFILYGPPDEVERHPNEPDTRPYEIWTYHGIQGGVYFVFGQRRQGGGFEQLHSTLRNEIQDDDWMRRLSNN